MAKTLKTVDTKAGVSARDILSNTLGKKDFNMSDVESFINKEGLTGRSARQVKRGAEHFFNTGNDYRLTDDGGFNVISSEGPKTTSSRTAGNSKGRTASDLVGLGNNVSSFMGLVQKYNRPVAKPAAPSTTGYEGVNIHKGSIGNTEFSDAGSGEGQSKSKTGGKKPATTGSLVKGQSADFEQKIGAFHDKYNNDKKRGGPGYQYSFPERPEEVEASFSPEGMTPEREVRVNANRKAVKDFFTGGERTSEQLHEGKQRGEKLKSAGKTAADFIFGDLTKVVDPETYSRAATIYNPAQIWSEEARQKGRDLAKSDEKKYGKQGVISSTLPNMGVFTPLPFSNTMKVAKQATTQKLLEAGKSAVTKPRIRLTNVVATPKPKFRLNNNGLPPKKSFVPGTPNYVPSKGLANGGKIVWGAPQMAAGGKMGSGDPPKKKVVYTNPVINDILLADYARKTGTPLQVQHSDDHLGDDTAKYGDKFGGYDYVDFDPNVSIDKYPKNMQAIAAAEGLNPEFPNRHVLKHYVKEDEAPIVPQYNKDKIYYASYGNQPKYKKAIGGKLGTGGKVIGYNTDGSEIFEESTTPQQDFQTMKSRLNTSLSTPKSFADAAMNKQVSNGVYEGAGIEMAKSKFETNQPKYEGLFPQESVAGDVAGKVAKYALPFIGEALGRKQLKDFKPTPFTPTSLMTGTVQDMARPNMRLRYREPVGPDVQSEIAGQKFGDAQDRDKRVDFETANSASRIQQRDRIVDRTNQGAMFDAQGKRMWGIYGDQTRAQMTGAKAQSMVEPFKAAQHHLATDIASDAYLKSDKRSLLAEEVIKHPEKFNAQQYQDAIGYLKGAKGMKFKTKFAYA